MRISDAQMTALHTARLDAFRSELSRHWDERLGRAAAAAGPEGRKRVLDTILALSDEDPGLTRRDLTVLADLMLVGEAGPFRGR